MATRQQKEQLIEALRSKPECYEIVLSGYGGEIVVGSINSEQYEFWKDREDLADHCSDWENEMNIPESAVIVRNGNWHECDDLSHWSGCEFTASNWISVYNRSTNQLVFECSMDLAELESRGLEPEGFAYEEFYAKFDSLASHAFMTQSIEKGIFYTGDVETLGQFDPQKLSFSVIDIEGWQLINGVSYASKIVDDTGGYSTSGKAMDFRVFKVEI
jgi:hypothetical protein